MKTSRECEESCATTTATKTANFRIGKAFENYRIMQIELPKKKKNNYNNYNDLN